MGRNFWVVDRDQEMLLPISMRDWLDEDHLVWFVLDAVERVDMTCFETAYRNDGRGGRAHDPVTMIAILLYAYTQGIFSSRQIEKQCRESVAFRVICGLRVPDHTTISRFRARHEKALGDVLTASLLLCGEVGLASVGTVALDGTKIKAQATGHATVDEEGLHDKATAWGLDTTRWHEDENTCVDETLIANQVQELLVKAKHADTSCSGERTTAGQLRGRADRQARFDQAQARIKAKKQRDLDEYEAKVKAQEKRKAALEKNPGGPTIKHPSQRKHPPRYKVNLSDPDSGPMKTVQGFLQGYNVQAWANENHVILGVSVVDKPNDNYLLIPMIDALHRQLEAARIPDKVEVLLADAGYCDETELAHLATHHPHIDAYIAANTGKEASLAKYGPIPKTASWIQRMRRKVGTKKGLAHYRKRRWIIEPVFARIKHNTGFTRFSRRGLAAVTSEFQLLSAAQNIKTAFTHHTRQTIASTT